MTSSDPRYLDATLDEMFADYWAHRFIEDPKAKDQIEDDEFDLEEVLRQAAEEDIESVEDWEEVK